MSASFEMHSPARITVDTVGEPGQRTFYLQASEGRRTVALKLEKQQVAALAELISELLADVPAVGDLPSGSNMALDEPVLAEWAVGNMQLAYDTAADRIVVLAEELVIEDPDGSPEPADGAMARMSITREQAAGLAKRGAELVSAGRPPCPLCGNPLDAEGHSCPRTNGHRPPSR
ncbi:MAG: DUF3090 family protein [Acidimicrobiales bacterium]